MRVGFAKEVFFPLYIFISYYYGYDFDYDVYDTTHIVLLFEDYPEASGCIVFSLGLDEDRVEQVFDEHVGDGMSFVAGNLRELMRVKPEQRLELLGALGLGEIF